MTEIDPSPVDDPPRFVEFDLVEFWAEKALWAANYFVLWPLGLALTVNVDTMPVDPELWCGSDRVHSGHSEDPTVLNGVTRGDCSGVVHGDEVTNLHVRQWEYPEGVGSESINATDDENREDYQVFLGFVRDRILAMKQEERRTTIARYAQNEIASPESILAARS